MTELGFTWKEIILAVFMAGGIWAELKAIRRDIKTLSVKQEKYNNLQERMLNLEIWKKLHEKEHDNAKIR